MRGERPSDQVPSSASAWAVRGSPRRHSRGWALREHFELYDLSSDPDERFNPFAQRPPALAGLLQVFERHWLVREGARASVGAALATGP